jgi:hypothetical protein
MVDLYLDVLAKDSDRVYRQPMQDTLETFMTSIHEINATFEKGCRSAKPRHTPNWLSSSRAAKRKESNIRHKEIRKQRHNAKDQKMQDYIMLLDETFAKVLSMRAMCARLEAKITILENQKAK